MRIKIEIDDEKVLSVIDDDKHMTFKEGENAILPEEEEEIDADTAERLEVAAELEKYCKYLSEAETISIKLIIAKCKERKEVYEC